MATGANKSFNLRGFVTLTAAVAGLGLPITGLANHVLQMEPMSLSRHAWMSAHNTLGLVFLAAAIWHAILNRRLLFNHIRGLAARHSRIGREAVCAISLVVVMLFIVVGHAFHLH